MSNTASILLICVLVAMSAYFSATETAFTSSSRTRLNLLADKKNKRAIRALELLERYDRLLSTILIGNNIVNILSTSLATVLMIRQFGEYGSTLSTIVMTVTILIFGEITPKILAKESPERFAMFSAPYIRFLSWILMPLNALFSGWKKLLSKLIKTSEDRRVTEEELLSIVEEACEEGGIDVQERELICSAIEFNDLEVVDILTPRVNMQAVPADISYEQLQEVFKTSSYSRLPVYDGSVDNILGILNQKDFYLSTKEDFCMQDLMGPPVFMNENAKIGYLLKLLQRQKAHMAIITDEYGGTLGIVTMEDILEELVGEIWDEHDEVIEEITQIGENAYKVLGTTPLDKIFKLFDIEDEETDSATLSGWTAEQFDRIPVHGEDFIYANLKVEVLKSDTKKVDLVKITVLEDQQTA